METKAILEARKQAEKAVADMPDSDLKLKAFEIILGKLLEQRVSGTRVVPREAAPSKTRARSPKASGLQERILELSSNNFFSAPRAVAEVQSELGAAGFPYKYSDVAVGLLRLTRKRVLRRIPYSEEGRKAYKYCLP